MDDGSTTVVDDNVSPIPPQTTVIGAPKVAFNVQSTLQSPFFWLIVGVIAGVFVCKKSKDWFR